MTSFTLVLRAFSVFIICTIARIECQRHKTSGATGLDPFYNGSGVLNRGQDRSGLDSRNTIGTRNQIGTKSGIETRSRGRTGYTNVHSSDSSKDFSYTINVSNSGQNNDWRQDKLSSLQDSQDVDRLTNIQKSRPPNVRSAQRQRTEFPKRTDVRRRGSPNPKLKQQQRIERRNIFGTLKSVLTRPFSRSNKSSNRRHLTRTSDVKGRSPLRRQRVGDVREPPLYRAYKLFYNETVASCGNGTYICKFNTTATLIEHPTCIPLSRRCDGMPHCPLGDDEAGCPSPVCKSHQVRCHEGTCAQACDGIPECNQLEDEIFCAPVCLDGQLRCPGGNCAIVCDGKLECKNGEDERNCRDVPDTKVCKYGEVLCRDRKTCAKVCDGVSQCKDGVDEEFACD